MALFRWLVVRRLGRERGRTLLAVAGVALGVAVFVAIRLASRSALASFADTVDAVAGRANLQVVALGDGFDERAFLDVRREPGVEAAAPVVQVAVLARAGADAPAFGIARGGDETLLVLGLDPLAEAPFVRLETAGGAGPAGAAGALELIGSPRTIAVTRAYAARHALAPGGTVHVLAGGEPVALTVVALLETPELQRAMGGTIAVTDIATAQEVFGREGRLDRIDLVVDPARREAVARALRARLPHEATVQPPASRSRQVENMVRAFELNLAALAFIAVFVATFLIFNTLAMAVVRQRRDIGVLRALGLTRRGVAALWLGEAALLGALGSAFGLVLGAAMAGGALRVVGRTLTDLYALAHTREVRLDPGTLVAGVAIGLGASLASALLPALEAAGTPPGLTLRQGALIEAQPLPLRALGATGAGVLAAAAACAAWTTWSHVALGGFACAALLLVGFSLLAPAATLAVERLARRAARPLGIEVVLGARALREAVARAATVVSAVMVAVAMLVALTVMVGSFRRTVDTWITQTIRGDLYVEPVGHRVSGAASVLPPGLVAATRALPGVAAVDTYRATPLLFRGALSSAVGIDFGVQSAFGHLALVGGADPRAALARARAGDGVLVSESFAYRHRLRAGDTIELPAARGPARARIEGVFYDYSTDGGAVFMDGGQFERRWATRRIESMAIYLRPGTDAAAVRRAFLARVAGTRLLAVTPNQDLRRRALKVFDQTFQVTWALQGIAVLVAVLGVVGTLTALVLQRGREIGILRASGATRAQVRRMVLTESGLIGLAGSLLGCVAGTALALVLVLVINKQFFGWSVRFTLDPWVYARAIALMVGCATLAGLVPAQLAATRVAAEAMRTE
jgi:putative ABC transport system permease protein